jgi:hypothetical protein
MVVVMESPGTGKAIVKASTVSHSEMEVLKKVAKRILKNYRPAMSGYPSEVYSISETPQKPPSLRVQEGMFSLRMKLGGETWEFYATLGNQGGRHQIDKSLKELTQRLAQIREHAPLHNPSASNGEWLLIFESPRHFFIPDLHAELMPGAKTLYLPRKKASPTLATVSSRDAHCPGALRISLDPSHLEEAENLGYVDRETLVKMLDSVEAWPVSAQENEILSILQESVEKSATSQRIVP